MPLLTRRRLLGAASVVIGAGALEAVSFTGAFDHRGAARTSARDAYLNALAALGTTPALVHVGHSTHLVSIAGARFLTDPWFYDPAFGALAHDPAPAVAPEAIGELACILVTHDHADHADLRAIDRLDKRAVAVVATADLAARVRALGFVETHVLVPWEELVVRGVTVHAVPALHDIYEIGYVLEHADVRVYFAGDTRSFDGIREIKERLAPDVAILPVDGTRLTGGAVHTMDPEEAAKAARVLGLRMAFPSHAEARFTDPVAAHLLASTVSHATSKFAAALARVSSSTLYRGPRPGESVSIGK